MTQPRRTFGPVVLLGAVTGIVLAMAGAETWFSLTQSPDSSVLVGLTLTVSDFGVVPAANAVALAGLACWGVLLVTRGRFRRVIAVLGLLTGLSQAYTIGYSYLTLPDDVREQVEQVSPTGTAPQLGFTGWFWVAAVAAALGLLAWVAAVRYVKDWPEMGRRYDTPVTDAPEDLWKALDHGHDPTS